MVLALGWRWSARARADARSYRWRVPVSADDNGSGRQVCRRRTQLGAQLHRLFVSGLQYEHRIITDRRASVVTLGKNPNDDSGVDFPARDCLAGGALRKHPLITLRDQSIGLTIWSGDLGVGVISALEIWSVDLALR